MADKRINEKKSYLYLAAMFALIITLFFTVRLQYGSLPAGTEPYFHARMSQYVSGPEVEIDGLMGRVYTFNPYHLLLKLASGLGLLNAMRFLPVLFGFLSIIFFMLLLKRSGLDIEKRFLLLAILIFSPAFIYSISFSNPHIFALFLGTFSFYLFFIDNRFAKALSFLFFLVIPLFGVIETVITVVLLSGFYFVRRNKAIMILIFTLIGIYLLNFNFTVSLNILDNAFLSSITDLGGAIGFGVFTLLLSLIGFLLTWRFKRQHYVLYLILILLFFSVKLFGSMTNIYLNVIFAYLAALAFSKLLNREWDSELIKYLTIFVLISGLIFSGLSYLDRYANSGPDQNVVNSLNWLKQNSETTDIVFSHASKGFWIEFFANRKVVGDSYTVSKEVLSDMDKLFWSRNLETTKALLLKYNVKYIWIDREMKDGQVWNREYQGLMFLFKNEKTFGKVYDLEGIEIWETKALN